VKSLLVGILVLVINLGCGGYGSGMGMTAAKRVKGSRNAKTNSIASFMGEPPSVRSGTI
jgi:hypothetical protein